jgi:hypothetical protein
MQLLALALVAIFSFGCLDTASDDDTPEETPDITPDLCEDDCNGLGECDPETGACECDERHTGDRCEECAPFLENWPQCAGCLGDQQCVDPSEPYCVEGGCVECRDNSDPVPDDRCGGVCALEEALCTDHAWECSGPGYEEVEVTCDGFDNDCDGETDEGDLCPDCTFDIDRLRGELDSTWDIDFDPNCNTYLTTLVSGPDWTKVVPEDPVSPTLQYFGNANQNMGFALVDPDPRARRVIVNYSCCPTCGCQAQNGLTLLYTCDDSVDPNCGCAGQTNCPGFLDAPFLPTGALNTSISWGGFTISTPNGLAVGPENHYYVGNFKPATCSDVVGCTACDPDNPGVFCDLDTPNCCDPGTLGRFAEFTPPTRAGEGATWRVVKILDGEEIIGLASGRDGSVLIGTRATASTGNLYVYDPVADAISLVDTYDGTVVSITQDRLQGDWYVEVIGGDPKIHRLNEALAPTALPAGVPPSPPGSAVLQWGPDGKLYRLQGSIDSSAMLDAYEL